MNKTILILASSGRMLAQSARRAGLKPLVIDLFADQDTREVSESFQKVKSLMVKDIISGVDLFINHYDVRDAVYGSGLEIFPESLAWLNHKFNVFGNTVYTFSRILNKIEFFRCLNRLGIPFPQVQFHAPENAREWLIKPFAGEGGADIRQWRLEDQAAEKQTNYYWQRQISGISMSVLFLADGQNVQVIGYNRQWTEADSFVFSGIIKTTDLPAQIQCHVRFWLTKLVPEINLQGLNSLDFIVDGEQCRVLEINPRPPASMALYDTEFKPGLLLKHMDACRGRLTFGQQTCAQVLALQVLYASKDLHITAEFDWPDWTMDRPVCPCIIHKSKPICSIMATDLDSQQVYRQLRNKQQIIIDSLEGR